MRSRRRQPEIAGKEAVRLRRALAQLLEAARYAEETSGDPWEFAIEIHQLRELGLSDNDLRYLVRRQFVAHSSEVTKRGNDGRRFNPTGDLYFTKRTCFVLTPRGIDAAIGLYNAQFQTDLMFPATIQLSDGNATQNSRCHVPIWDNTRHVLYFDGRIVKQFRSHASNQMAILSAFEEECWPARIDDPLAPLPTLVSKRRLLDAIKCLNRGHTNKLIHFRGDGLGQGVIWELANGWHGTAHGSA